MRPSSVASAPITTIALAALFATAPTTLHAQATQQGNAGSNTAAINAVKKALDKYKDPIVAVREGYYSTVGCVDFPAGGTEHGSMEYKPGAMGVHFINMSLVGPKLDSTKPQVLLTSRSATSSCSRAPSGLFRRRSPRRHRRFSATS